jgi:hypothetical protein
MISLFKWNDYNSSISEMIDLLKVEVRHILTSEVFY